MLEVQNSCLCIKSTLVSVQCFPPLPGTLVQQRTFFPVWGLTIEAFSLRSFPHLCHDVQGGPWGPHPWQWYSGHRELLLGSLLLLRASCVGP